MRVHGLTDTRRKRILMINNKLLKFIILAWIISSAAIEIWKIDKLKGLESQKPMIVYKVDNAGAEIHGKVIEKGRYGKLYTITIRDYGVFVVTEEQFNRVKIGEEVLL